MAIRVPEESIFAGLGGGQPTPYGFQQLGGKAQEIAELMYGTEPQEQILGVAEEVPMGLGGPMAVLSKRTLSRLPIPSDWKVTQVDPERLAMFYRRAIKSTESKGMPSEVAGFANKRSKEIFLRDDFPIRDTLKTALHEAGHSTYGSPNDVSAAGKLLDDPPNKLVNRMIMYLRSGMPLDTVAEELFVENAAQGGLSDFIRYLTTGILGNP